MSITYKYLVFNKTDGVLAHPDYMTEQQADTFISDFSKLFARQGYYKTAMGERIDPKDVVLEKIRIPMNSTQIL